MKQLKFLQKLRWKRQKGKKVRFVDYFVVLVAFFLQNCISLRKQPYWTTVMRWKIQKGKKVRFVDYFVVLVAIFFYKTAFLSANNPIGQQNHSLLIVFVLIHVLIHEISRNLGHFFFIKLLLFL